MQILLRYWDIILINLTRGMIFFSATCLFLHLRLYESLLVVYLQP